MRVKKGGIETEIGHWAQLMEGLQESPQHFYEAVTAAIERREIPDCRLKGVWWREGGVFSARRAYLRAKRAGYLIDICGAPFGNAFFASSWLCLPPPSIWLALLVAIVAGGYGFTGVGDLVRLIQVNSIQSFQSWPALRDTLIGLSVQVGGSFLVAVLVFIFGVIRPLFFPPRFTFYRYDTAEMFYSAVHEAVKEVIQGLRSEQGLRLLTEDEMKPIMRGLGR
jgi:hypothetical protein